MESLETMTTLLIVLDLSSDMQYGEVMNMASGNRQGSDGIVTFHCHFYSIAWSHRACGLVSGWSIVACQSLTTWKDVEPLRAKVVMIDAEVPSVLCRTRLHM